MTNRETPTNFEMKQKNTRTEIEIDPQTPTLQVYINGLYEKKIKKETEYNMPINSVNRRCDHK